MSLFGPDDDILEDFNDLDLETGNQLVILVWNPESEDLEIENPHTLPYPMVLGLLHQAIDELAFGDDDDDDNDD
jgi:hypothetical protein